jgi:hypothetical protein
MAKSRAVKRDEALVRNAAWQKLTPAQQLKSLDKRGLVAEKQRKRIHKLMEAENG